MTEPSVPEQIACVRRELRKRRSCYPDWVRTGKMSAEKAEREILLMEAVLQTLLDVLAGQQMDLFP